MAKAASNLPRWLLSACSFSATLILSAASVVLRLFQLVPPAVSGRGVSPTTDSAVSSSSFAVFQLWSCHGCHVPAPALFPPQRCSPLTALAACLVPFWHFQLPPSPPHSMEAWSVEFRCNLVVMWGVADLKCSVSHRVEHFGSAVHLRKKCNLLTHTQAFLGIPRA